VNGNVNTVLLPKALDIVCPVPVCRFRWMRPRGGVLRKDGLHIRKYVCPACGATEIVKRVIQLPSFKKK